MFTQEPKIDIKIPYLLIKSTPFAAGASSKCRNYLSKNNLLAIIAKSNEREFWQPTAATSSRRKSAMRC
jgi:hypothetical protein